MFMKYALFFVAGALCPFIIMVVLYWVWAARGDNTGWPM
jgi:hypothetical protein